MRRSGPQPDAREVDERGFSLVEVVVALFIIGIVAAAGLIFFVRAMQNTSHLQRSQASVAVATQAMELVRSVNPQVTDTTNGTSGLLIGRSQTASTTAWNAAATTYTAQSTMVYDTAAASRPKIVLPVVYTTRVSDITYTVTTLIGTCYRPATASTTDQTCTKTGTGVMLYRATIIVSWPAGNLTNCGTATSCSYALTTLIDPTADANWNLTAKPVAYDDAISTVAGSAAANSDILANDVMGPVTANPTTITVAPTLGTATAIATNPLMGGITYTPPANASGTTVLSYRLKDAAGRTSNEANVAITVLPKAVSESTVTVGAYDTVSIPVLANDLGTGLSISRLTATPSVGTTTIVGNTIQYKAPTTATTVTIKYVVIDASGNESAEASVPITVTSAVAAVASNQSITLPYSAVATTANLDILAKTGNPANFSISNVTAVSMGTSTVTLNSPTNNVATFNQPAGLLPGNYTFTFKTKNLAGTTSTATGTYTVTIAQPVAVQDTGMTVASNLSATYSLGSNDTPASTSWNNTLKISVGSSSNTACGSVAVVDDKGGTVKVTAKTVSANCTFTFTYQIVAASGGGVTSNTVTNTVTVTK